MFEAMEAVQGQDKDQRFLPLVLRYTPDDRSLDEEFVLGALEDLAHRIEELERRLVKARAYELGAKLDKLNYVRANLPHIFNHVQERLYPQFDLWNASAAYNAARRLLRWLKSDAPLGLPLPELDVAVPNPVTTAAPRLQVMPKPIWNTWVGHCAWRNAPLVSGNDVFVATAGELWNKPDPQDGIRCLDAETGELKWFTPTPADANRMLLTKGLLLTGCDDGTLITVASADGSLRWRRRLDGGVTGGPLRLPVRILSQWHKTSPEEVVEPVLVATYPGTLYLLNLVDGQELQKLTLATPVVAAPLLVVEPDDDEGEIVVPGVDGTLHFATFDSGRLMSIDQKKIYYRYSPDDTWATMILWLLLSALTLFYTRTEYFYRS
jgi:hypothetical protein